MSEISSQDKKLYDYTEKLLEHVTAAWMRVKDKHDDIYKLMEFDINSALMDVLPEKFIDTKIKINEYGVLLCVSVDFITEGGIGLVVKHLIELPTDKTCFVNNDMSKITDNKLRDLTIKMMEKTTKHYLNAYKSKESDNINKLIERDVAMRIVTIVPDKYTEIAVNVVDSFGDIEIAAVFKTDAGYKLCVDYEYVVPYDPTSQIEDFVFPSAGYRRGRGSKVETLPCGQGLGELTDLEYFKVMRGLKLPAKFFTEVPIDPIIKKPTVDFSKISLISTPTGSSYVGYSPGMWSGVDLATVDVQERIERTAKEISDRIDREILASIEIAARKNDTKGVVPTFGWTEETTEWDTPKEISWKTHESMLGYSISPSEFGGVITTDAAAPCVYRPPAAKTDSIEITIAINRYESEVMEFA